jgi:hypothetical protein
MIEFPRELQYLSIASDIDNTDIFDQSEIDHGDFFRAIQGSPAGQRLRGLRFNMMHRAWIIVPAPGMHELTGIRYLELSEEHIVRVHDEVPYEGYPVPQIECPLECLFPPNLEVLKITPSVSQVEPLLWDIVTKVFEDDAFLPRLRRIIVSFHYRDDDLADKLRQTANRDKDKRLYCAAYTAELEDFPVWTTKPDFDDIRESFARVGVDMVLLYEDTAKREIFREGAGPSVWEIPEQIAEGFSQESKECLAKAKESERREETEVDEIEGTEDGDRTKVCKT